MFAKTFTARRPEDLLALVPYLLGFHPEDSLVLLTFGATAASFHARVDLPIDAESQREVAALLVGAARNNSVEKAMVMLYSDDAAVSQAQAQVLLAALGEVGVEVIDVLRADGDRYFRVGCDDEGGTAYDLSSHAFTAECVLAGQRAHSSREELADSLVGVDQADASAVERAARRFADSLGPARRDNTSAEVLSALHEHGVWFLRRIREFSEDRVPVSPADAGRMLVLAALVPTRDAAWAEMSRKTAVRQVELWQGLVRRSPRDLYPGAGALLAFAAWLAGDGALAWCALDRCLEVDPDYSLGHLVAQALTHAVPPTTWVPIDEADLPIFQRPPGQRAV